MNYYIVKESSDENIVGKDFSQCYKCIKGYDPDAPRALFSLYWKDDFPDYIPDLDGMMLAGSAKLTDFVSNAFTVNLKFISPKAKAVMEQYNLGLHKFHPLGLYKRKVKQDYYAFHLYPRGYIDYVDFEKTSFVQKECYGRNFYGEVEVNSLEEFLEKRKKMNKENLTICGSKIVMGNSFDKELDFFEIRWIDTETYVSERLKNAIEENGLTGWEFVPALHLTVD